MGPSTPRCTSPWRRSWLFLLDFLCWSWSCFLLVCSGLFVSRVGSCLVIQPFKTRPVSVFCLGPSLSFCLVCSPATFFLFFLSLSQALGKPKPLRGLGFPLWLFFVRTDFDLDPFFLFRSYIKVQLPHLFFFFCLAVVRVGCGRFFVLGMGSRFGQCFGWFWLPACCPLALLHLVLYLGKLQRRDFRPQWRLAPFPLQIGSSRVTRLLLGVDPGTVRSAAGRGRGRHCDPTNS